MSRPRRDELRHRRRRDALPLRVPQVHQPRDVQTRRRRAGVPRHDSPAAAQSLGDGADDQSAARLDDERLRLRAHVAQRQQHPQRVVPHVVRRRGLLVEVRLADGARRRSPRSAPHQMLPQLLLDVLFLRVRRLFGERGARRGESFDERSAPDALALEPGDVVLVHSLRAVVAHVVDVGVVAVVVDGVDGVVTRGPLGRIGLRGVEDAVLVHLVRGPERGADEGV
mmetsp:Transcript_12319/g.47873  ORF Transcript_12319/g.47873 Transcript_12319/m.47873 type:complete len:225 (-) Transcript_12319:230-904(-)